VGQKGKKPPNLQRCPRCQGDVWKQEEATIYGMVGLSGGGLALLGLHLPGLWLQRILSQGHL
jgi:hypothetical protein